MFGNFKSILWIKKELKMEIGKFIELNENMLHIRIGVIQLTVLY